MKKNQIIIITIIIIAAVVVSYFVIPQLSFTQNNYVDFPQGFRPYRQVFGIESVPLVVEGDEDYATWKIEITLKPPTGSSQTLTYFPTVNHADTNHPDNWLGNGPFYIDIPFSHATMDELGTYTITKLDIWATSTVDWEDYGHKIDSIDTSEAITRRQMVVKYDSIPSFIITPSKTSTQDGEQITVTITVENTCEVPIDIIYEAFIDKDQNGIYNTGDRSFGGDWDESLGVGQTKTTEFPLTVSYSETIDKNIWVSVKVQTYDTDNTFGSIDFQKSVVTVNPPPFSCSAGGPYANTERTIEFSGSASGGTPPYTFLWDFGDGYISSLQNPIHTYPDNETYSVTFTVTDSMSEVSTDTTTVTIAPETPAFSIILFALAAILIIATKKGGKKHGN